MSIKKVGMQGERELFVAKIRRGHEAEDIDEVMHLWESTIGKKRTFLNMDDFSNEEADTLVKVMCAMIDYRNTYVQQDNHITSAHATILVS